ncbi:ThiF family adenylyltransferase [Pseudomonas sp. R2.Fl]|nr:ThiF family adenylyltransferase [Pseudomonas sp. R2.Fl]
MEAKQSARSRAGRADRQRTGAHQDAGNAATGLVQYVGLTVLLVAAAFAQARDVVRRWLDQAGALWARPAHPRTGAPAWEIDLHDPALPFATVTLVLPVDFPARPCRLYVDPAHFLKVPHVESDGHLCLGVEAIPSDYDEPVHAVLRALTALRDALLAPAADPQWVERQFHAERVSYWAQHCHRRRNAGSRRAVPEHTYVDVGDLERWTPGVLVAYGQHGRGHHRLARQIAVPLGREAEQTAQRHGWNRGMLIRGGALFVNLPSDRLWTPTTWPDSYAALQALVSDATGGECLLSDWVRQIGWGDRTATRAYLSTPGRRRVSPSRSPPPGVRPLLVVLAQDGAMFGFQVFPPVVPGLQCPHIEPVRITRIDPAWTLARDHGLDLLRARGHKRVLLLGCGSLGSSLAQVLVRAGVGQLDIVDSEIMETENTARHALGLADAGQGKACALARRLRTEVPGLSVRGIVQEASSWCALHCCPGAYDLVIECTANSAVRTFLSHMRATLLGDCPILHAWVEPWCSAGHVVLTQPIVPWPAEDPADTLVNASDLDAADTRVSPPACSSGFHPYGAADIALVAAFTAERAVMVLDHLQHPSVVWSWVRSSAYFAALPAPVRTRAIVPVSSSAADSATTTRDLEQLLRAA